METGDRICILLSCGILGVTFGKGVGLISLNLDMDWTSTRYRALASNRWIGVNMLIILMNYTHDPWFIHHCFSALFDVTPWPPVSLEAWSPSMTSNQDK